MTGKKIKRNAEKILKNWKTNPNRTPLILRGARQVGKSHLVETVGKNEFETSITINLEKHSEYIQAFKTFEPKEIISTLELLTGRPIVPGKTLLFIDEIQEEPRAISALRYFKEEMPELHIIAAGSLLEFKLSEEKFKMPVGRISYFGLDPISFDEYIAHKNPILHQSLQEIGLSNPPDEPMHNLALKELKAYMAIGGMPEAQMAYFNSESLLEVSKVHRKILDAYEDDFVKYAETRDINSLKTVLKETPKQLGKTIKYVNIDPNLRSERLKTAIHLLNQAGVISKINNTSASGLPLGIQNPNRFKLLYTDIGLALHASGLSTEIILEEDVMNLNKGHLAEQFVGQELKANQDPYFKNPLYYWERDKKNSQAEIDYILTNGQTIIPVEVKAGKTGRLRSLKQFMTEKNSNLGIQLSQAPLKKENNLLKIPLYLIKQLPQLLTGEAPQPQPQP